MNPPTSGNPRVTIGKPGAVFRLVLSAAITFLVALQTTHASGTPLNGWALLGAVILTLKEIQSYLSTTWSNAFGQVPATSQPDNNAPATGSTAQSATVSTPAA